MSGDRTSPRVAIVAPIAVRHDAISAAARDKYRMFRDGGFPDTAFLTSHNEFGDIPAIIVPDVGALLRDPSYRAADVLIYHFGVYNPLIDALLTGNGHAAQFVVFHNITPAQFLPPATHPLIERSFRQLHNLKSADHIWADSRTNADILLDHGFDPARIEILPLVVERPSCQLLAAKPASPLEILFVGRAMMSKGLLDGLKAFGRLIASGVEARLTIIGNLEFSDATYLAACRALVETSGLTDQVVFARTATDDQLAAAYHRAHILLIPSYHEGFCVPIVEALRAGCVPVGYRAGNIPALASGFGRLADPGDIAGLAVALETLAGNLRNAAPLAVDRGPTGIADYDRLTKAYVQTFSFDRVAAQTLDSVRRFLKRP